MTVAYLDSSVLIAYLYGEQDQPENFTQAQRLMNVAQKGVVGAMVSFYAFPELYSHAKGHFSQDQIATAFRTSLLQLFSLPIIVAPFLERAELNEWRAKFKISDQEDARHVASALANQCDAIISFDHHFQQVSNVIPVYTPEEFLATIESN